MSKFAQYSQAPPTGAPQLSRGLGGGRRDLSRKQLSGMFTVTLEATTADSTGEKAFTRPLRQLLCLRTWHLRASQRCKGVDKDTFTPGPHTITGTIAQ